MLRTRPHNVDDNPPPNNEIERNRTDQILALMRWQAEQERIRIDHRQLTRWLYTRLAGRERVNSRRPRR